MSNALTRRTFTLATLGAAFAPSAPALAQAREKVMIAWLPIMQTTAFYVAQEEKLFEKAGIEVEAVRFEAPNQIIDALVSGRAEVGAPGTAAGITVLAEVKFPGTFKVFGLQGGGIKIGRINDGLIVASNSSIARVKTASRCCVGCSFMIRGCRLQRGGGGGGSVLALG
ncbi:ABC transporter substrate-binding protein [Methylorubrum populi]|jgi:NitT/TauT family transport system substrate-binding protein|uniref:ABC transporter substrate-binding protein n=1 Tax=Methylorubrum populi TaxID=223967 RepID=UPI001FCBDAB0|nr:hypothetical protein [Methylorubrum populi]